MRTGLTRTKGILTRMMKENTGKSPFDSGDYMGRHYELDKKRNFNNEPCSTVFFRRAKDYLWIDYTKSAWWHCVYCLKYIDTLDKLYHDFVKRDKLNADMESMLLFARARHYPNPKVINTYNEESNLDRVLQYIVFSENQGLYYILLQTHNGADVRGGYSTPKAFLTDDGFCDFNAGEIWCPSCKAVWDSDDTSDSNSWDCNDYKHLYKPCNFLLYPCEQGKRGEIGKLIIREDERAFCPLCGKGILRGL